MMNDIDRLAREELMNSIRETYLSGGKGTPYGATQNNWIAYLKLYKGKKKKPKYNKNKDYVDMLSELPKVRRANNPNYRRGKLLTDPGDCDYGWSKYLRDCRKKPGRAQTRPMAKDPGNCEYGWSKYLRRCRKKPGNTKPRPTGINKNLKLYSECRSKMKKKYPELSPAERRDLLKRRIDYVNRTCEGKFDPKDPYIYWLDEEGAGMSGGVLDDYYGGVLDDYYGGCGDCGNCPYCSN